MNVSVSSNNLKVVLIKAAIVTYWSSFNRAVPEFFGGWNYFSLLGGGKILTRTFACKNNVDFLMHSIQILNTRHSLLN